MSLVNLGHVCSHLQNASLARLGLTSISYTKLHLSVCLVLHKQGFISSIKLAGRTPPLSSFPPGVREAMMSQKPDQERRLPQSVLQQPEKPVVSEDTLTDAEIDFLLANYTLTTNELQDKLSNEALQSPGIYSSGETQRRLYIVDRHRRLVREAENLVKHKEAGSETLRDIVTRVLQHQPQIETLAPTNDAQEIDVDEEGVVTQANRASRRLWLGLKYWKGEPVLRHASLVSKPKKRLSLDVRELRKILHGHTANTVRPLTRVGEIMILNTSQGVLEARECLERHVGGAPLCRVW